MSRAALIFAIAVALLLAGLRAHAETWQPLPGHMQLPIWPGVPPDAQPSKAEEDVKIDKGEWIGGRHVISVRNVSQPTITVYVPVEKNTGAAVLVFPGGGYQEIAIDLEGTEVCDWLTSQGVTCVLLKYRVPNSGPHWDSQLQRHVEPDVPAALQDAQRAIVLMRRRAGQWHIDPHKIGVLGFSAGGHLVAQVSTRFERTYAAVDEADGESCRPDFAVALYPGHLWNWDDKREFRLNPDIATRISRQTPPTFLLQAANDEVDDVKNTVVYYLALKGAGVPTEMHLYAKGGHAFGLRPTAEPITHWPALVEAWLVTIGVLPE